MLARICVYLSFVLLCIILRDLWISAQMGSSGMKITALAVLSMVLCWTLVVSAAIVFVDRSRGKR